MANIATITNNVISALSGTTSQVLLGDATLTDFKLDSLTDVNVPTPGDGDVLRWNATTSLWEASDAAGLTGSGTTNYLPKFTGASTLGNSLVFDNGSAVGIGTIGTYSASKLVVSGSSANGGIVSEDTTSTGSFVRILGDFSSQNLINWKTGFALRFATSDAAFGTFVEAARFSTSRNFIINNASTDNGLRFQVTGDGYFSGRTLIGASNFVGQEAVLIATNSSGTYTQNLNLKDLNTSANNSLFLVLRKSDDTYLGGLKRAGTSDAVALYGNSFVSFETGFVQRMLLDASGNLGLGVTPSAWASGFTALQVKNASLWSTGSDASITSNAYYDGSNYKYIAANGASRTYHNVDGSIAWFQAGSGSAGANITFTQAMTLDASGRLGIGTASPQRLLHLNSGADTYIRVDSYNGIYQSLFGSDDIGTYIGQQGNYSIRFITNGVAAARIFNTGNLAIGGALSSDAGFKLDVNGTMRVSGASTFSSTLAVGGAAISRANALRLNGASVTQSSNTYNAYISSNTSQGVDIGGSLGLGGEIGGGDNAAFAVISGRKENSTSGNYAGYFAISTIDGGAAMTEKFRIASTGAATFSSSVTAGGNIGTTAATLYAKASITESAGWQLSATTIGYDSVNNIGWITAAGASARTNLVLQAGGGNLGLGVVPSAWSTAGPALQLKGTSIVNYANNYASSFATNAYYNTSDQWVYYTSTYRATRYQQVDGVHTWSTAASGTANAAITFTQAMTLDASGNLGVGSTTPTSFDAAADNLVIGTTSGNNGITIASGAANTGNLFFSDGTSVAADKYRGFIQYEHTINSLLFGTDATERARFTSLGNLHIGTFSSDSGEKLQVNGTMRVSGASTFGGNMTLTLNQNGQTISTVRNLTAGTTSEAYFQATSDASSGSSTFGKTSSLFSGYKILTASSGYIYNGTAGNLAILNDVASGFIVMAAGGSSTAHLTIASTGAATFSSSVTAASGVLSSSGVSLRLGSATGNAGANILIAGASTTKNWSIGVQQNVGGVLEFTPTATNGGTTLGTTPAMVLTDGGNLGIANTNPSYKLDVTGEARVSNAIAIGTTPDVLFPLKVGSLMTVSNTGNVGIGNTAPDSTFSTIAKGMIINGGATGNTYLLFQNSTTGTAFTDGAVVGINSSRELFLWNNEAAILSFGTGGTEKARISSTGNFGIGTSGPIFRLDVNGTVRMNNTVLIGGVTTLSNLAGADTRIVVADASGILSTQPTSTYLSSLSGEATNSGNVVTLTNSAVIGKVLTGLNVTSAAITASDSILTAFGKIQGQIDGLQGGTVYKGSWNASTNTPTITSGTGTQGHYYVVTTAGTTTVDGISSWAVGDWIIFNGTVWEKIPNVDSITSVNGQTGVVSLTTSNISEGTNLYYTDTRARAAISLTVSGASGSATYSSGVLNIPTYTLVGLGGAAAATTITINGVAQDLSANRTFSVGTITSIVAGSYLTGGTITTSGTIAVDATTTNTGNKIVARDASGNFAAGTITANLTGTASLASQVSINYNNNSDASYQMLWGSGNSVYGTAGITCNPFTDSMVLTGTLFSGGLTVTGFGRMYGGDFWHSGTANNGSRTPTIKLGRFSDSENPAYTIYTDDSGGDILEFYSERFTGDFRLTRNSETGLRNMMRVNSDNGGTSLDLYTGGGSTLGVKLQSNGDARFAFDVVAYYSFSDARLKTNVATIENPLQKVMAMRGVTYEWNEGYKAGKKEIGLIAQEVMEIIPEVVAEKERVDGSKFLSVDYEHLTGLLIEAVKELKKEVDELKSK